MKRWLAGALVVAGCSGGGPASVTGLLVDVQGDLTTVTEFTLLVGEERLVFVPSPDGDYGFPLPHLRDHLRGGEPVVVGYIEADGELVATSIQDG